jgi:hypothetical protein
MARVDNIKRACRFSLRNLFVFLFCLALALGWAGSLYQQHRKFQPTPFFASVEDNDDIKAAYVAVGLSTDDVPSGIFTVHEGQHVIQYTWYCHLPIPVAKRAAFVDAFIDRVIDRLEKSGFKYNPGCEERSLYQMREFAYHRGNGGGTIEMCVTDGGSGDLAAVIVKLCEARGGMNSTGVGLFPQ